MKHLAAREAGHCGTIVTTSLEERTNFGGKLAVFATTI